MRMLIAAAIVGLGASSAFASTSSLFNGAPPVRNMSVPVQSKSVCEAGQITCREYCAKCNPVSACEVACVKNGNRCVGSRCRDIHKK